MTRIKGNNLHGNKNEKNLVEALNNKKIKNLNSNLKKFIQYICVEKEIVCDDETIVTALYEKNNKLKQDIYIIINQEKFGISLKMGVGNSTHQEKIEDFISYLKLTFNVSEELCNEWRFFIWADGTFDGSGSQVKNKDGIIISRFSSKKYKKEYPEKLEKLQKFLNLYEKSLVERFLFLGRHNSNVDFLYHGTTLDGTWISKDKIIDFQLKNPSRNDRKQRKTLSVGRLGIQSWNISQKGTSEKKRGELQAKYSTMAEDIYQLMMSERFNVGSFEGNKEEFDLSRVLNRHKNHSIWSILFPCVTDFSNYYAVKVTKKVKSKLSGKKVSPKTDVYVIEANIPQDFLLENGYILTDEMLSSFDINILPFSGISVKMKDSTKYTIQKFTVQSFLKAFEKKFLNPKEILFSLLMYSKSDHQFKNHSIAKKLGIDYKTFLRDNLNVFSDNDIVDVNEINRIRTSAQDRVMKAIKNDKDLYESIFMGKHWFEEPYSASYIFSLRGMEKNELKDFYITTGSGRTKGDYSIEIKPKL